VLWHYTDMSDPRWTWGKKYIQLQQDSSAITKQKAGIFNKQGWIAYSLKGDLFVKKYDVIEGPQYPDYGCNVESYTDENMLEMETLGPLANLAPGGGAVEYVEHWSLHRVEVGRDEKSIDEKVLPLVKQD